MFYKRPVILAAIAICATSIAVPAQADVKAGVDAWSRGDYPAAIKEWQGPAASGDADAQFNMAQAYKWGKGVSQDLKKAEFFYGKAAAQGHQQASDEYGLLLFDRGERKLALPYIKAAAGRGDPRAQYLLAIANFNGDLVTKDWVRAYALMTLARNAGLPQAMAGIQQMDGFIPMAQRQQGVALSQQLVNEIEAKRAADFAAADLGVTSPPSTTVPAAGGLVAAPPGPPTPEEAVALAEKVAKGSSPKTAGADYARPANPPVPPSASAKPPLASAAPAPKPPVAAPTPPAPAATASGPWRVQLGAFGVMANADALWAKVRGRPELAGHPRINVAAGAVTKLQAGGFSESAARAACARLAAAGLACAPVRN